MRLPYTKGVCQICGLQHTVYVMDFEYDMFMEGRSEREAFRSLSEEELVIAETGMTLDCIAKHLDSKLNKNIKIYTSYFNNMKNIGENYVKIAICTSIKEYIDQTGLYWIKELAPDDLFFDYLKDRDADKFERNYKNKLSHIDKEYILKRVTSICEHAGVDTAFLLCYESKGKLCHRHWAADWLGIEEYEV